MVDLEDFLANLQSRVAVRFAIGIVGDLGTPEMIAEAMETCIAGPFPDATAEKWIALSAGIARLKGTPVPCVAHFEWASA